MSLLPAATLLVSAGHRPVLPAGCSPFLHLPRAALPDAVGALEHCSTKDLGLADADLPQVLQTNTPLWWASLWELCILLAMAMAWRSRMGLVLITGADERGGVPLQGPFLSQVPNNSGHPTPATWKHAILYYTILYYTILYYTILYYTILYYTIPHYTIWYDTIRWYTRPHYTILYYTIIYYTILYYTILYYTIQYSWNPLGAARWPEGPGHVKTCLE